MAKCKTFEGIPNTEFRWPTKGDKPFTVADDPFDNANIAHNESTRLVLMMTGYKEAADLMVDRSANDRFIRDTHTLAFARVHDRVKDRMALTGVVDAVGADRFFDTLLEGTEAFVNTNQETAK